MKAKHIIYRSKGCRTCRARKVKCDEARPICQRCVRAQFECRGYGQPTTFLSDNPQAKAKPTYFPSNSSGYASENSTSLVPRALPYPVEMTSITFLVHNFAIGIPGDGGGFSWLRLGLDDPDRNSLFSTSSRCLAEIYYGRVFRRGEVLTDGMAKYGSVLRQLRQQLQDPGFFLTNNLMAIVMTVTLIETVSNQSTTGLFAHLYGFAEMTKRAGPRAFQSQPNILVFGLCRCFFIGRAIKGRHHTFVAEPEWKTIPWAYSEKNFAGKLWDILADIPSLVVDLDVLEKSGGIRTIEGFSGCKSPVYSKLAALFQQLFDWRWEWEVLYSDSSVEYPVVTSELVTDESGNPWYPTILSFYNRQRATEIIYYDATLVYLFRIAYRYRWQFILESTDRTPPSGIIQPLPPSILTRPIDLHILEDASSEYFRSVEGCLTVGAVSAGHWYQLMFAVALLSEDIDPNSVQATWMKRIRKWITGISRLDMWAAATRSTRWHFTPVPPPRISSVGPLPLRAR